jgi:hypothetical protein
LRCRDDPDSGISWNFAVAFQDWNHVRWHCRFATHADTNDYLRRRGDGISARYFKQVMFISEVNGRISDLAVGRNMYGSSADGEWFVQGRVSDSPGRDSPGASFLA